MPIRIYCKALYDAKKKQGMRTFQIHKIISEYVIDNWLAKVAFNETVIYGLLKNCSIKQNLHQNMKLMSFVFIKLFAQEENPFTDDFL